MWEQTQDVYERRDGVVVRQTGEGKWWAHRVASSGWADTTPQRDTAEEAMADADERWPLS
jgi:hypothetical protein